MDGARFLTSIDAATGPQYQGFARLVMLIWWPQSGCYFTLIGIEQPGTNNAKD